MPTARTSESHPLRITAMTLGDGRGRIGFSQCPGRIDRYAISGPWKRDLDTDLDAIQRWGATAVVSLIIHEEIAYLKVHDLPRAVRDRHMEWWHAPIPDGEVPWRITLDNSKGISRLRFWAKKRRVNGINDLPVFMHQGRVPPGIARRPRGTGILP